jgi:lipopolysaccharide export LptBFGC system permease protein LptF
MGFGSFIGGVGLCILAVLIGFFGIVVLIGLVKVIASSYDVPLGIGSIIVALILFAYGWYLYKSAKPQGTVNVHNQ